MGVKAMQLRAFRQVIARQSSHILLTGLLKLMVDIINIVEDLGYVEAR